MALGLRQAKFLLMCDFDGTLFNSMPPKAEAMYRAFVERYPELVGDRAKIVKCFMDNGGRSTADMIEATSQRLGVQLSAVERKVMRDRYWEYEKPLVGVQGGFFQDTEALAGLAGHGVAVAITTGTRHEDLKELVAEANLGHVFSFVGGLSTKREEQGRPFTKGRPHLEFIARRLKGIVPPIYYYGDSIRDIHVALGTSTWRRKWGRRRCSSVRARWAREKSTPKSRNTPTLRSFVYPTACKWSKASPGR